MRSKSKIGKAWKSKIKLSQSQDYGKKTLKTEGDESAEKHLMNKSMNFSLMKRTRKKRHGREKIKTTIEKPRLPNYSRYSIENINEGIHSMLNQKYLDEEQLEKLIFRSFQCLKNFELYAEEEIEDIIHATNHVLNSQFDYLAI